MSVDSTQEWRDEVAKQFRYPGRVQLTMNIAPDILKEDIETSTQNVAPITSVHSTLDEVSPVYAEAATLEGIWRADGSMYLPSRIPTENLALPLWSDTLVSETKPLVLVYYFEEVTSFIGLTCVWDTNYNSWPADVQLIGYDASSVVAYAENVTSINSVTSILDVPMDNIKKLEMRITRWSKPQLRARVAELHFGVKLELTEKQIMSISEKTSQYFTCAQLPTHTQKYAIKNQVYRASPALGGSAVVNKSSVLSDITRIFSGVSATQGIATVETKYWKASGELYLPSRIVSENPDLPWMSEDSSFSKDDPIELVITYEQPVRLNRIRFEWDTITNSWPSSARIECRDSYDNVVYHKNFDAQGTVTLFTDLYVTVKTVHLYIYTWSVIGWRARISTYEAQNTYGNNSIPSEINNLFDPTLSTGYSKYLAQRQKIQVRYGLDTYDGTTLWLPEQVRFLDSWKIPTDAVQIELQSNTRLSFMTQIYREGYYNASGTTLMNLALGVLTSSDIVRDVKNPEPWYLADILSELSTTAPLPALAENALLQLIAGAAGCTLSTISSNGYVSISDTFDDTGYIIDEKVQLQLPSVSVDAPLRSIAVNLYTYSVDVEATELFNSTVVLSGTQEVTINYSDNTCATRCSAVISGAVIESQQFYGYYAVLKLTVATRNTEVAIHITGYKVTSSKAQLITYFDSAVHSGREVVIDNPLITNMQMLNRVAANALEYYIRRNTASTEYLGYPDLEAGDYVALYSTYFNKLGRITEHVFEYNGAFSGNLKILMEG